ncbi:MAG: sigma-70 family RNA polymerase sigma factor, partial [Ruminococcaceae bacterium]|nr:sigma-70 family RNA polymerase sigma factor [Oscillospiraceae bacterium]
LILLKAARTYDKESGLTFGLYARICIRNGFITLERKHSHDPKSVDLSEELAVPDTTNYIEELEHAEYLMKKIRDILTKREVFVFKYLILDYKYSQIADELKISQKSVENTVYRIKKKLGTLLF